jgi:hypothetical protein
LSTISLLDAMVKPMALRPVRMPAKIAAIVQLLISEDTGER